MVKETWEGGKKKWHKTKYLEAVVPTWCGAPLSTGSLIRWMLNSVGCTFKLWGLLDRLLWIVHGIYVPWWKMRHYHVYQIHQKFFLIVACTTVFLPRLFHTNFPCNVAGASKVGRRLYTYENVFDMWTVLNKLASSRGCTPRFGSVTNFGKQFPVFRVPDAFWRLAFVPLSFCIKFVCGLRAALSGMQARLD